MTDNETNELRRTGDRIINRLHLLIGAVMLGSVLTVLCLTAGVIIVIREYQHAEDDRRIIYAGQREGIIAALECLRGAQTLPAEGDLRKCVEERTRDLPQP